MDAASILIVDDEKNLRNTLADILTGEGYEVATAESGEKAVKMFEKRPYDLVLMDVRMPGMDGMEAFRIIRRRRRDAQVVMMSAYSMDHLRRRCLDEGAVAFVRKPLDVEGLVKLIRGTREMTILAVEPEPFVPGEVSDRLRRDGYRLLVVRTPEEALEMVRQIHSDVVLLDEVLCRANAGGLCAAIRAATPSSRIVLVASAGAAPDSAPARVPGPSYDACLVKPLRMEDVLALLARMRSGRAPEPV